jgi:hypothetical protein
VTRPSALTRLTDNLLRDWTDEVPTGIARMAPYFRSCVAVEASEDAAKPGVEPSAGLAVRSADRPGRPRKRPHTTPFRLRFKRLPLSDEIVFGSASTSRPSGEGIAWDVPTRSLALAITLSVPRQKAKPTSQNVTSVACSEHSWGILPRAYARCAARSKLRRADAIPRRDHPGESRLRPNANIAFLAKRAAALGRRLRPGKNVILSLRYLHRSEERASEVVSLKECQCSNLLIARI